MEVCNWLRDENATLAWKAAVLEGQAEQAEAREQLLVGGWAFWERRALLLEEMGWRSGAWVWIAQTIARQKFHDTQPLLLERPKPEIVEVTLDSYPLPL